MSFRMLRSYMTPDVYGDPPRPTHQEMLEDEQAREDYVIDVLPACRCIMDIARAGIER